MIGSGGKNKVVLVLGMHRSGTSLTAELIHAMGFSVPGTMLDELYEVNAHGFWESSEVVAFNEGILKGVNRNWFNVAFPFFENKDSDFLDGYKLKIRNFVEDQAALHGDLVIKDPRLCVFFPLWLSALDCECFDVKIIYVNRHPFSVASSIKARDGFSLYSGQLLWLCYFFSVFASKNLPEILVLDYQSLLSDLSGAKKLAFFLGVSALSKKQWSRIVDPSLQKNSLVPLVFEECVSKLAATAYGLLSHESVITGEVDGVADCCESLRRYLSDVSGLIEAINETNSALVGARSQLVSLGEMHSEALKTIQIKDNQLEKNSEYIGVCHARISDLESDMADFVALRARLADVESVLQQRDRDVANNAGYIARCEQRITELGTALSEFEALRARLAEVESALQQRDKDVADNADYIARCEKRITELGTALSEFEALRARLAEVESVLQQRDKDVASNADYIALCEQRITELGTGLSEFEALRARLAEVESTLQQRDQDVASNADYIARCEQRITELGTALSEFEALRARLAEVESTLQQRDRDVASNSEYIAACHQRIAVLDDMVAELVVVQERAELAAAEVAALQAGIRQNTDYIANCHKRIAELDALLADEQSSSRSATAKVEILENEKSSLLADFSALSEELSVANLRLDRLLSMRTVRLLERYKTKTVKQND